MNTYKAYASVDDLHADLVLLAHWLADYEGATAAEVADAIEKPWNYATEIETARLVAAS